MIGTDAVSGAPLEGLAHLRQSIRDILTTPLGSRVMRRDYGSELPRLVDAPLNPRTLTRLVAATAGALARWEPRIEVTRVSVDAVADGGRVSLTLEGRYHPEGRAVRLDGVVL